MCHSTEKIPAKTGDASGISLIGTKRACCCGVLPTYVGMLNFDESTFYEFLVLLEFGF